MFSRTAPLYDALYVEKDYEGEARRAIATIERVTRRPVQRLLDVGCATGNHLVHFQKRWQTEGIDLDSTLLDIAGRKVAGAIFTRADMTSFDLGRRFDVVTCLWGSIAYALEPEKLRAALRCMVNHLEPGGVLLLEPWHLRGRYAGGTFVRHVDLPDVKIARLARVTLEGAHATMLVHYLVGAEQGIEHMVERHDLALWSHEEYVDACAGAGLDVEHDPEGLAGRGMYIGVRP